MRSCYFGFVRDIAHFCSDTMTLGSGFLSQQGIVAMQCELWDDQEWDVPTWQSAHVCPLPCPFAAVQSCGR